MDLDTQRKLISRSFNKLTNKSPSSAPWWKPLTIPRPPSSSTQWNTAFSRPCAG